MDNMCDTGYKGYVCREYPQITLTMKDIERMYGIKKNKWRNGVKEGIFPQPLSAFKRPKRWLTEEVDASLRKEEC